MKWEAGQPGGHVCLSLSARRAWIEIAIKDKAVGRWPSLSARRAWIEIQEIANKSYVDSVALRKESVD